MVFLCPPFPSGLTYNHLPMHILFFMSSFLPICLPYLPPYLQFHPWSRCMVLIGFYNVSIFICVLLLLRCTIHGSKAPFTMEAPQASRPPSIPLPSWGKARPERIEGYYFSMFLDLMSPPCAPHIRVQKGLPMFLCFLPSPEFDLPFGFWYNFLCVTRARLHYTFVLWYFHAIFLLFDEKFQ